MIASDAPMPCYWLAGLPLLPGARVLPGNWGRVLRWAGGRHSLAYRELFLEQVRVTVAPDALSRFECCFLSPSTDAARRLQGLGRQADLLYEVSIVDQSSKMFIANMAPLDVWNVDYAGDRVNLERDLAKQYWSGTTVDDPAAEILVGSEIEIVRRL